LGDAGTVANGMTAHLIFCWPGTVWERKKEGKEWWDHSNENVI